MMELKDFIRDTLLDIVQGVKEAQEACEGTGIFICPRSGQVSINDIDKARIVSFNIVLGEEEGKNGSSGLKVSFPQFGLMIGKQADGKQKNSEQTSVSFTVPVVFPKQIR